jgi:hypothetical protein
MSESTSLNVIAICQILSTVAGIAAVAAIIYAVVSFKRLVNTKVDQAMDRVQPIVDQARSIAEQARETADKVSEKVDTMVARAESTVDLVGDKVESVSSKVEEAVNPQVIAVAGIVGTAVKAAQIYRDIVAARDAPNGGEPEDES